jgi:hypothetical protein
MQDNMKKMKKTLKPKNNFTRGTNLQRRGKLFVSQNNRKICQNDKKVLF